MIKRETKNTIALVLGSTQFGENSAIVSLAGEDGLFGLLAKGIYKPKSQLKPLLITGNIVQVEYQSATGRKRCFISFYSYFRCALSCSWN